jgi:NAD(P)-dependent dehydrogenase (short-subunit alcohol dehydrogenase family)
MAVVLITGAATGIGRYTAESLVDDGHTVWASMRDHRGRNAERAEELRAYARGKRGEMNIVELDVLSQDSADAAAKAVVTESGQIDVVINNAGHLFVGYVEAFKAEDIASLFDSNALGTHRVNRAVLPHMRERRHGTLMYVSSTIPITTPPFLGPYVASKAAQDMLALTTSLEVGQLGIETVIVMPGPFVEGTNHFPDASHAEDDGVTAGYAELDPLVARNEKATESLFDPDQDASPKAVGEEIRRILQLPYGERPLRTVIDFTHSGVEEVNDVVTDTRDDFIRRMGFGEVLKIKR